MRSQVEALREATPRQLDAALYVARGFTQEQAGQAMGITQQGVHRLLQRLENRIGQPIQRRRWGMRQPQMLLFPDQDHMADRQVA